VGSNRRLPPSTLGVTGLQPAWMTLLSLLILLHKPEGHELGTTYACVASRVDSVVVTPNLVKKLR
jgi:hypothetical protein